MSVRARASWQATSSSWQNRATTERGISKRERLGEGRPTKRTPEVIAKIAEAVAIGLTDDEASLLAGINPDTNLPLL
jgi:hypothetical protein